jgi:hypothetical protein
MTFQEMTMDRSSFLREAASSNNRMHADKIKLRRYALQLYFSGDAGR